MDGEHIAGHETKGTKVAETGCCEPVTKARTVITPVMAILMSLLFSILAIVVYHYYFAPRTNRSLKIIAVDLKGFLADQKALYLNGKLTDEELETNFKKAKDMISKIPADTVVLSADVVLRNVQVVPLAEESKNDKKGQN